MHTLFVLGRQPEISLVELESLSSAEQVRPIGDNCAICEKDVDFSRLGSSQKSGPVIATYSTTDLHKAFVGLSKIIPELIANMPAEGKIKLGASVYGLDTTPYQIQGELLKLKKTLRAHGRSARVVPNETPILSSATTYHNRLTHELGLELAIVRDNSGVVVARITNVQDIDAYRIKDRERPRRDAFVGMLPPKLAQTMINLANPETATTIYDPFCGTGVILMEAALQGYGIAGSDISEKMVLYTTENLSWLSTKGEIQQAKTAIQQADATKVTLPVTGSSTSIVTETYLGRPLGGQQPTEEKILEIVHGVNTLARDFLKNIAPQVASGSRHCIAFPAWYIDSREYHLPVLDELAEIGFDKIQFTHAPSIIYRREDQLTAREIIVVTKK